MEDMSNKRYRGKKYRLIAKLKPYVRYSRGKLEMGIGLSYLMDREDFVRVRRELEEHCGLGIQLVM